MPYKLNRATKIQIDYQRAFPAEIPSNLKYKIVDRADSFSITGFELRELKSILLWSQKLKRLRKKCNELLFQNSCLQWHWYRYKILFAVLLDLFHHKQKKGKRLRPKDGTYFCFLIKKYHLGIRVGPQLGGDALPHLYGHKIIDCRNQFCLM